MEEIKSIKCSRHPNKIATHTKMSWIKNKPRLPICQECHDILKNYNPEVYHNLKVEKI